MDDRLDQNATIRDKRTNNLLSYKEMDGTAAIYKITVVHD